MFDEDIRNYDWYVDENNDYRIDINKIIKEHNDSQYMLEMYPSEAKILSGYAKEAVDLADFKRSFIYDEYPDKLLFYQMVEKVYKRYMTISEKRLCKGHSEIEINCIKKCMKEMAQIIVANEICKKRSGRNK